jgi:hypothetical protein
MYQYYKINAIGLKAIPQPINGSYPPTAWAYLLGNDDISIAYDALPRLPGSKIIPNTRVTTRYFKRFGRNPDFNYYINTQLPYLNSPARFSIRMRFASEPTTATFIFQVTVFLTFSMMVEVPENKQEVYEEARTQPTMPVINPKVIEQLNESVTSFNLTTSNLDITEIQKEKEKQKPKEETWPKYKYKKFTSGIKKMVQLGPGQRWQYAETAQVQIQQAQEKLQQIDEDDLFAECKKEEQIRKIQKYSNSVEKGNKLLDVILPTGQKAKTSKPLTTGQVNQLLTQEADQIKHNNAKALLVRIANKPLEKQADSIQKYLKTCDDIYDKKILEDKLNSIQAELVKDLLE